jgi:hypothetical protein
MAPEASLLPWRPVRTLTLTALAALVLAAPALGFRGVSDRNGDLDGDAAKETAYTERVDVPGVEDDFDPGVIRIKDTCGAEVVDQRISARHDGVATLKLRRIDTRRGAEVFYDMRSGASARQGEAKVVAWRRRSGTPCRKARALFKYRSTKPTRAPRGTTGEVSGFVVKVGERARRYRGKEVILAETFLRRGEPSCCGSVKKISYWRYSRARDKYLRYRTVVKRGVPPG